ncbi:MAG: hypothetical protein ABS81_27250 [Pseudonocardia sp. SCN 72-86]|nr:MAG: hypothetical protein ABS81_27250 [Pseudonocardia sp. SCN 72-86]
MPLCRVLTQVERQLSRLVEGALADEGLTVDQWRVLDLLSDGKGHSMSDIAMSIVVPGPTLTKIMDKLAEAALVFRLVDERDRRRVLAHLSEKGVAVHRSLKPRVKVVEAEALAGLGDSGAALVTTLSRLAAR